MSDAESGDVTRWIAQLRNEKTAALAELGPEVYREIKQLARSRLRRERPDHTLQTTGLVNEAFVKFCEQRQIDVSNRREFFSFAAECMRRVLVDHARAHQASKRGSGEKPGTLDEQRIPFSTAQASELTEVDQALDRLSSAFPRGCEVVKLRLFGGLTLDETAQVLEVSGKTVQRDYTASIAWLRKEIGSTPTFLAS